MADELQTGGTEQTQDVDIAEASSIEEHAQHFDPDAPREASPAEEAESPKPHHSTEQRRDRQNGQWNGGKRRHRAQSQMAGPEDVPRIRELTTKNKELLAEIERLKGSSASPQAAVSAMPVPQAVRPAPPVVPRPAAASTATDPEPQEHDPKYGGDYAKWWADWSRWNVRDEHRKVQEAQVEHAARATRNAAMDERVRNARETYPDFDAVADAVIQRVPQGSVIEEYFFTRPKGNDVLHYFGSHPQELDAILRMTEPIEQFEALTLLSQRLASQPSGQAVKTGAVAGRQPVVLPPTPPTPVRTEAQRTSDGPPSGESLSIAEHQRRHGDKSRRR